MAWAAHWFEQAVVRVNGWGPIAWSGMLSRYVKDIEKECQNGREWRCQTLPYYIFRIQSEGFAFERRWAKVWKSKAWGMFLSLCCNDNHLVYHYFPIFSLWNCYELSASSMIRNSFPLFMGLTPMFHGLIHNFFPCLMVQNSTSGAKFRRGSSTGPCRCSVQLGLDVPCFNGWFCWGRFTLNHSVWTMVF